MPAYPGGFDNVPLQSSGALITSAFVNSQTTAINNTQAGVGLNPARMCEAVLTLTTGTPYPTSDVTSASTVYLTALDGGRVGVYAPNTSAWTALVLSGDASLILSGLTANTNYDVFVYNNNGAVGLELGPAWTNDNTRATGLVLQDGILVKSGDATRRYGGTLRTVSTSATADSSAQRFLWNMYNRAPRSLRAIDATASWTYATAGWRQANGNTANQVEVVVGFQGPLVELSADAVRTNASASVGATGIGIGSTTALGAGVIAVASTNVAGGNAMQHASYRGFAPLGHTYYAWLEYGSGAGDTWYGTSGQIVSGLSGFIL